MRSVASTGSKMLNVETATFGRAAHLSPARMGLWKQQGGPQRPGCRCQSRARKHADDPPRTAPLNKRLENVNWWLYFLKKLH